MISVHMTPIPRSSVVAYRDDGPISRAMGFMVAGQLPPLPPLVVAAFVIGVLMVIGIAGSNDWAVLALAMTLLLAGPGSSHPHDGRYDWLAPPLLRGIEYICIAAVGFAHEVGPLWIFALLGAMAFHHYDLVYRIRQRVYPPPWLSTFGLGWDGRMIAVSLGVVAGWPTVGFGVLAAYLWAFFGWESLTCWLAAPRGERQG
ncbi:DUF5941 domain-containing protein [Nonomuraea sp. NPDC050663]|uniref:DUF5941 domain-containing protein n=1 Tax=Nonomuraea sp. NPDC050663 TaxID=3364370 RepID=UPI0037944E85